MTTNASVAPTVAASDLAYDRCGSGPALVLIHGLGGERHVWAPVVERIAGERDVVTVDLPGFGESPPLPPGAPPAPAALAAAIGGLIESLGLERPHVAGNSLGGWVALELAAAGRAASVTAIAPAGLWAAPLGPKPYVMHRLSKWLAPVIHALLAGALGRRLALGASVAHPERLPRAAAVRMVRAYAGAPGFVAVNDAMRAGRFTGGEHIDVPVTIAWCEHDRIVSRPRAVPVRARELVLAGCGHVPTYDDPDAVAAVLLTGSDFR